MVAHIALFHVDHLVLLRVVVSGYPHLCLTFVAVLLSLNLVLAEVQILVVDRASAQILTIDIDSRTGHLRSDVGIATRTDIYQHLVGTSTRNGNGIVEVAHHTEGRMLDNQFLGTTRHIEPYLTRMLLCGYYTQRTAIERKAPFWSLNLNQSGTFTVLVHFLCTSRVSRQIVFQQFELHHFHALCHCLHGHCQTEKG